MSLPCYLLEKGDKVIQPIFQTDDVDLDPNLLFYEGVSYSQRITHDKVYKTIYVTSLSSRDGLLEVLIKYDKKFAFKIRWFNASQLEKLKRDRTTKNEHGE